MSKPIFDEMLAVYPPEKRELARAAFNRFVDGDSTQFFTQLFLLLDVYANYTSRIPQAVKQANDETLATLNEMREEIGGLAKNVESRSVNLNNATEETTARCLETQKKCEAAAQRLEKLTKEIGKRVDTEAIVQAIRESVEEGVEKEVIKPFMQRTEELSEKVLPTLESIQNANEQAARVWPERIWKIALVSGLILGLAVAIVISGIVWRAAQKHYERALAGEIVSAEKVLDANQDAFQQLGVADVPIKVVRVSDPSTLPSGYALIVDGIYSTEERNTDNGKEGIIYFASKHDESQLEGIMREAQAAK